MENLRPIEFFKNLNQFSKFERKRIIYDYTDKFNSLLAPDFFEEYEEFKLNLALKAIELTGLSENYTAPKWVDKGDFWAVELSFDVTDVSTRIVEQINGTVEFEPQANDIRGLFIEDEPDLSPFKNKFDSVPECKVIDYFTKNLVDKKYLSKETLDAYLRQAFEIKTPGDQRFCFDNIPTQEKIRKIFYEYFKTIAGKPNGKKLEYVKLLGEYFVGFDTTKIETNFSK
jgi:hypothetical protein